MHPVSSTFLRALRSSHTPAVRVDAHQGARCIMRGVPFSDGAVNVSSGAGVHRTLDLTIADPSLWDLLSPVGTELRAYRGIRYPGGSEEMVPLGVFGLDNQATPVLARGVITVSSAPDRWAKIQRARFETPRASSSAMTNVDSVVRLVTEVTPAAVDTSGVTATNTLSANRTAVQVWDRDRDAAVTGLCTDSGIECFYGPTGGLVVRNIPVMGPSPVWRVHAGHDGVMASGTATRDRTRVYNVVVVVSSKTDGTPPFAPVIVEDNDPLSPTNVDGPYGRVPYFLTSATLAGAEDARKAGRALLARTRGRFIDMAVEAVVNPALEAGDTVSAATVGGTALYLLDSFTVPLTSEGKQSLTLRSLAAVTSGNS